MVEYLSFIRSSEEPKNRKIFDKSSWRELQFSHEEYFLKLKLFFVSSLIGCPIHSALRHIEAESFVNY